MTNFEYYKTKEAAEKAYRCIDMSKRLFETIYNPTFVEWLYEEHAIEKDNGCTDDMNNANVFCVLWREVDNVPWEMLRENLTYDEARTCVDEELKKYHNQYRIMKSTGSEIFTDKPIFSKGDVIFHSKNKETLYVDNYDVFSRTYYVTTMNVLLETIGTESETPHFVIDIGKQSQYRKIGNFEEFRKEESD